MSDAGGSNPEGFGGWAPPPQGFPPAPPAYPSGYSGPPVPAPYPGPPPAPYGGYGPQPGYQYAGYYAQPAPGNGLGVAGFVTGLIGLIFCWVPFFGFVLAVLGVALGGAGMASGHKNGSSTGLAIAGLVCGIVALIPAILLLAAISGA